ncbi:MAG TPA: transposase [Vicinamibacterales bacterium]|jgi:hypothetical protein|nr:transposase [Vicinamibacterales bacterium]
MARSSDPAKAAQWRERLERFGSSSVSVARFCRREGVSVASFYHWRKKLAVGVDSPATRRRVASQPCAFQPVTVVPTWPAIAVHLPGGARVEVPRGEVETLRVIVRELVRSGPALEEGDDSC